MDTTRSRASTLPDVAPVPSAAMRFGAAHGASSEWRSQLNYGRYAASEHVSPLCEETTMLLSFALHARAIRQVGFAASVFAVAAPSSRVAGAQGAAAVSPANASAEARIRAIIEEQVHAWNAGDGKTFSRHFAEDGSFTNIQGAVFYGHRAFEDRHIEIFRTFFKGTKLAMTPTKIRFVRPDVAIADIATVVSELGGRTSPGVQARADGTIRTRLQQVFVKDGADWSVASYHNVDVKVP
jgi:uncharacterized protein (TIGR02246 family)